MLTIQCRRGTEGLKGPGRGCNEWHKLPFSIPFNLIEANGGMERDADGNVLEDTSFPTSSPFSCVFCILYVLQIQHQKKTENKSNKQITKITKKNEKTRRNQEKLDWVAPLITDPPPTSFTTVSYLICLFYI